MSYRDLVITQFGGLNLRDNPQAIGANGATDMLNVQYASNGFIQPRAGFDSRKVYTDTDYATFLYALPASNLLLTAHDGSLETLDNTATVVDTLADVTAYSAVDFATTIQGVGTYIAGSTTGMAFCSLTGSLSAPTFAGFTAALGDSHPNAKCVSVTPWDFRLVVEDGNDNVAFSAPGDPLTFNYDGTTAIESAGDALALSPNDSEFIQAIVAWRDYLFVFKQTKFFVFYATSTETDGSPVFEFRTITNVPALAPGAKCVAVSREGVYFLSRSGVYLTTGDTPKRVSGPLDPLFSNRADAFSTGGNKPRTTAGRPWMHWAEDRLYVAYPVDVHGNNRIAVLDEERGQWLLWGGLNVTAMCTQPVGSTTSTADVLHIATFGESVSAGIGGPHDHNGQIGTLTNTTTYTDARSVDGTTSPSAIFSTYTSGLFDCGNSEVKTIREMVAFGAGEFLAMGVGSERETLIPGASVVFTQTEGRDRTAHRGTLFSYVLQCASGFWQLERLVFRIRETKLPGDR